jgi:NADH:ubiquinone oxidoreductase subunit 3 (subunit A)
MTHKVDYYVFKTLLIVLDIIICIEQVVKYMFKHYEHFKLINKYNLSHESFG